MKKFLSLLLVSFIAIAGLVACGGETYEIALITDKGNIDDKSFNQGAWEGVVAFAEENEISHQYYKPEAANDDAYLATIALAVEGGAKVIVTPGFLFGVPVFQAQTLYPDVKFILLDAEPHNAEWTDFTNAGNVAAVYYAEEESGYLAGYAAVADGFEELGFMGGQAVPAVQAFGYGFLQGAEQAAIDLGLGDGAINVQYHYTGDFAENAVNKATANTMYQGEVEVIFACGGSVGKSVMSAAEERTAKVIGVDVDQRYDSETVITSATKGLAASVIAVLDAIYKTDTWSTYGGTTTFFNAANDGVGLPTIVIGDETANAFDRFTTFDKAAYDVVFATLVDGTVDPIRTFTVADDSGEATALELTTELSLVKVVVTVVE